MSLLDSIKTEGSALNKDPHFPHAPADWTKETAIQTARQEGLVLGPDHWEEIRALQEYYTKHRDMTLSVREMHDALEERFHGKGGIKYLYQLFPSGPVAQGCRIAGLTAPAGATDKSFGSVV